MRRGIGIAGLQRQAQAKSTYAEAGQALASEQIEALKTLFGRFKADLEAFAKVHQKEIGKSPMLRAHFQRMCASIGVDPLASSKGFWADILGVGDFYYELGVKVVEACFKLREQTGGLVDVEILKGRLQSSSVTEYVKVENILSLAIA